MARLLRARLRAEVASAGEIAVLITLFSGRARRTRTSTGTRLALVPEVTAPWSEALRAAVARQTPGRWFLNYLRVGAVSGHIAEADHGFPKIMEEAAPVRSDGTAHGLTPTCASGRRVAPAA